MYESPRNAGNVGKTPKMHSLVFCLGKSLWLVCHAVIAVQVLSTLVFRPSKTARSVYFELFVGGFIAQFRVPAAPKSQHQASWGPSGPPTSWLTPHMRFQHLSQNLRIEGRIVPSACWGEAPTRLKVSSSLMTFQKHASRLTSRAYPGAAVRSVGTGVTPYKHTSQGVHLH